MNYPDIPLPSYPTVELSRQPLIPTRYTPNPTPWILNMASGCYHPIILLLNTERSPYELF